MGMYLTAYKKVGDRKFEHDYRWPDDKWHGRYNFYCMIADGECVTETTRPKDENHFAAQFDYYAPMVRPKNIDEVRKKLNASEYRENQPFHDLLDLMEKDGSVFVQYD